MPRCHWTKEQDSILIDAYKSNSFLYDKRHADWRNYDDRDAWLERVSKTLKMDQAIVRTRLETLRDTFSCAVRRVYRAYGAGELPQLYERECDRLVSMRFLLHYIYAYEYMRPAAMTDDLFYEIVEKVRRANKAKAGKAAKTSTKKDNANENEKSSSDVPKVKVSVSSKVEIEECPICDKEFPDGVGLGEHQSKERHMFSCPVATCEQEFYQELSLEIHQDDLNHYVNEGDDVDDDINAAEEEKLTGDHFVNEGDDVDDDINAAEEEKLTGDHFDKTHDGDNGNKKSRSEKNEEDNLTGVQGSEGELQECAVDGCTFQDKDPDVIIEHYNEIHDVGEDVLSCHLCNYSTETLIKFSEHITEKHRLDQKSDGSEVEHPLLESLGGNAKMEASFVNSAIKESGMGEVKVPGNGYCFSSSVLLAMYACGIDKSFEHLCIELIHEAKVAYDVLGLTYRGVARKDYLQKCTDFIERGDYGNKFADICINSAAQGLGINLFILQKDGDGWVMIPFRCKRFKSKIDVFLFYHSSSFSEDYHGAHYNPLVSSKFYKKNRKNLIEKIIVTNEDKEFMDKLSISVATKLRTDQEVVDELESGMSAELPLARSSPKEGECPILTCSFVSTDDADMEDHFFKFHDVSVEKDEKRQEIGERPEEKEASAKTDHAAEENKDPPHSAERDHEAEMTEENKDPPDLIKGKEHSGERDHDAEITDENKDPPDLIKEKEHSGERDHDAEITDENKDPPELIKEKEHSGERDHDAEITDENKDPPELIKEKEHSAESDHEAEITEENKDPGASIEVSYECPLCENDVDTVEDLKNHQLRERHVFHCPTCPERFLNKVSLNCHQKSWDHYEETRNCTVLQESEDQFSCAVKTCKFSTKITENVAMHYRKFHNLDDNICTCHVCDFSTESSKIFQHHLVWHQRHQRHNSCAIYEIVANFNSLLNKNEFNFRKLIQDSGMTEVGIPSNGFCFVSSILITLMEKGIDKNYPCFLLEVMYQLEKFHETCQVIEEEKDLYLNRCASFFQHGNHRIEVGEDCVNATATALGVNIHIFTKVNEDYEVNSFKCGLFISKINLLLVYHKNIGTEGFLSSHFNPVVDVAYLEKNLKILSKKIILRTLYICRNYLSISDPNIPVLDGSQDGSDKGKKREESDAGTAKGTKRKAPETKSSASGAKRAKKDFNTVISRYENVSDGLSLYSDTESAEESDEETSVTIEGGVESNKVTRIKKNASILDSFRSSYGCKSLGSFKSFQEIGDLGKTFKISRPFVSETKYVQILAAKEEFLGQLQANKEIRLYELDDGTVFAEENQTSSQDHYLLFQVHRTAGLEEIREFCPVETSYPNELLGVMEDDRDYNSSLNLNDILSTEPDFLHVAESSRVFFRASENFLQEERITVEREQTTLSMRSYTDDIVTGSVKVYQCCIMCTKVKSIVEQVHGTSLQLEDYFNKFYEVRCRMFALGKFTSVHYCCLYWAMEVSSRIQTALTFKGEETEEEAPE